VGDARVERLERLARSHSVEVANYLRRRIYPLSPSDLDDLVEEVLLVVWRRIDAIPADAELPWMIGVARNVLNNARRAQSRRDAFSATYEARVTDASAEEYVVADVAIRDALGSLSESDREVLLLHFWDGLDAAGLSTVLSITSNAAAVRLSRALARFREAMEKGENG
jgi:RNA polymerase sigma-70 factor (ECF subfamily)